MDFAKSMRKTKKKKDKPDNPDRSRRRKKTTPDMSNTSNRKNKKKTTCEKEKQETSMGSTSARKKTRRKKSRDKKVQVSYDIFEAEKFSYKFDAIRHPGDSPTDAQKKSFESFAKSICEKGVDGLMAEYTAEIFPFIPYGFYSREIFDKNTPFKKNRYKDVVCNDMCRVVLKDGRADDYIHANYVRGLQPLLILTQGPMPDSVLDFWRMIVQEGVTCIFMLCEFVELGKRKCENYFPTEQGGSMTFGDFNVVCESVNRSDSHVIQTNLIVSDAINKKVQKLTHNNLITWPDKTVAKCPIAVIKALKTMRTSTSCAVVHCSAGIGRTGTFVAIEIGIQALLNSKNFKLPELVRTLRYCRLNSVQMDTQYLQLAETLLECGKSFNYITTPSIIADIDKLKKGIAAYVAAHPPPAEGGGDKNDKNAAAGAATPAGGITPATGGNTPSPAGTPTASSPPQATSQAVGAISCNIALSTMNGTSQLTEAVSQTTSVAPQSVAGKTMSTAPALSAASPPDMAQTFIPAKANTPLVPFQPVQPHGNPQAMGAMNAPVSPGNFVAPPPMAILPPNALAPPKPVTPPTPPPPVIPHNVPLIPVQQPPKQ